MICDVHGSTPAPTEHKPGFRCYAGLDVTYMSGSATPFAAKAAKRSRQVPHVPQFKI
jgi:hypothetical protein